MNRRVFLGRRSFLRHCAGGVIGAVFSASAALAENFQSSVVAQLRSQGYRQITIETTLLGRVRIAAERGRTSREIILNPRTGEILRDVVLAADGEVAPEISDKDVSDTVGSEENKPQDGVSPDEQNGGKEGEGTQREEKSSERKGGEVE